MFNRTNITWVYPERKISIGMKIGTLLCPFVDLHSFLPNDMPINHRAYTGPESPAAIR